MGSCTLAHRQRLISKLNAVVALDPDGSEQTLGGVFAALERALADHDDLADLTEHDTELSDEETTCEGRDAQAQIAEVAEAVFRATNALSLAVERVLDRLDAPAQADGAELCACAGALCLALIRMIEAMEDGDWPCAYARCFCAEKLDAQIREPVNRLRTNHGVDVKVIDDARKWVFVNLVPVIDRIPNHARAAMDTLIAERCAPSPFCVQAPVHHVGSSHTETSAEY